MFVSILRTNYFLFALITNLKIQKNKQKISSLKESNDHYHDVRSAEEVTMSRVNPRWTKDECSLVVMGFQLYGQNFKVKSQFHHR